MKSLQSQFVPLWVVFGDVNVSEIFGLDFASHNGRGGREEERERERDADRETDRERERDNKDAVHKQWESWPQKLTASNEGPSAMLEKGKSHKVVDSKLKVKLSMHESTFSGPRPSV